MISGWRLGASFIVLFVGFMYYVRGRREPDGLYIGVVALLTTWIVYAAGIPLGYVLLKSGWFDSVRFGSPGLIKVVNEIYKPDGHFFDSFLPLLGLFAVGVAAVSLLAAALRSPCCRSSNRPTPRFERIVELLHQKLHDVHLRHRRHGPDGVVSRLADDPGAAVAEGLSSGANNIIPYVMGAQIATSSIRSSCAAARRAARLHDRLQRDGRRLAVSLIDPRPVLRPVHAAHPAVATRRRATVAASRSFWGRCSSCRPCCCWSELRRFGKWESHDC